MLGGAILAARIEVHRECLQNAAIQRGRLMPVSGRAAAGGTGLGVAVEIMPETLFHATPQIPGMSGKPGDLRFFEHLLHSHIRRTSPWR